MRREKCGLHPLIHTLLEFNLAQNMAVSQLKLHSRYDNGVGFVNRKEVEGVV
jgi:hypothetical protein